MKTLFFIPIFFFFINISFSQNVVNFTEGGVEFNLYLTGEFTYKVPNGVSKTTKNYDGQISSVGTVKISYDFSKRISKIGTVAIRFNFTNKIIQVGGLTINYDTNGNLSSTSGQVNQSTNTNSNSQTGNIGNSSSINDLIVVPELTELEKEYAKGEPERQMRMATSIGEMITEYKAIKDKDKVKTIPDGFYKVNVVFRYSTSDRVLLEETVVVVDNEIRMVLKDLKMAIMVQPKGKIMLGKGYYQEFETNFNATTVKQSEITQEVYFTEYLQTKKAVEPYEYSGEIQFSSNNKKVIKSKYMILALAKTMNGYKYEFIGGIIGGNFLTFRAKPDMYKFRFLVGKIYENGWELVNIIDDEITLPTEGVQKVNINP